MNSDTLTVLDYARQCAVSTFQDLSAAEVRALLVLSDSEVSNLYLLGQDGVTVTGEQRAAFGAEFRRELLERVED